MNRWVSARSCLLLALWCSGLLLSALATPLATAQTTVDSKPSHTVSVKPGLSARAMAQRVKPEQATVEQTWVALWLNNPRAFVDGNINQLRRDATLQVPSVEDILLIPPQEARAIVAEQTQRFRPPAPAVGTAETPSPRLLTPEPALKPHEMRITGVLLPARDGAAPPPVPATNPAPASAKPNSDAEKLSRALQDVQNLKLALEQYTLAVQGQLGVLERNIVELQRTPAPKSPADSNPANASGTATAPASAALPTQASPPSAAAPDTSASEPGSALHSAATGAVTSPATDTAPPATAPPPSSAAATEPVWQSWLRELDQLTLHPDLVEGFEQALATVQVWAMAPVQVLPWWPLLPAGAVVAGLVLILVLVVAWLIKRRRASKAVGASLPLAIPPIMTDINLNLEPAAKTKTEPSP